MGGDRLTLGQCVVVMINNILAIIDKLEWRIPPNLADIRLFAPK